MRGPGCRSADRCPATALPRCRHCRHCRHCRPATAQPYSHCRHCRPASAQPHCRAAAIAAIAVLLPRSRTAIAAIAVLPPRAVLPLLPHPPLSPRCLIAAPLRRCAAVQPLPPLPSCHRTAAPAIVAALSYCRAVASMRRRLRFCGVREWGGRGGCCRWDSRDRLFWGRDGRGCRMRFRRVRERRSAAGRIRKKEAPALPPLSSRIRDLNSGPLHYE